MKKTFRILTAIYFATFALCANAQTISTFAGNASIGGGYTGDGGAATAATLLLPAGTVMDAAGNVYIADRDNHVIRKINTSGVISTAAGTGTAGSTGDGGAATAAQLSQPVGLNIDATGNLYIAEYGGHRIRMINSSGIISTVAGSTNGYAGDGGAATAARLSYPTDLAFDAAGNMYISDYNNGVVRKVNTSGIITTFAGGGSSYADGIPATNASFWANNGVRVDAAGNVYIADMYHDRICKVTTAGLCYTIAGDGVGAYTGDGGAATAARVSDPAFLEIDKAGNIFFTDNGNYVVRKINTSGIISTVAGNGIAGNTGDGGPATSASIGSPAGLLISPAGELYFLAQSYHIMKKVTAASATVTGASNICVGATTTFTAGTPGAVWSSSNPAIATVGATSGIVSGVSAGTVTISYSMGLLFGSSSITIDPCFLSVDNIQADTPPYIYPNPASGNFTIALPEISNEMTATIFDFLGREVKSISVVNTRQIDVSSENIPSGNYIIKLSSNDKVHMLKLSITK